MLLRRHLLAVSQRNWLILLLKLFHWKMVSYSHIDIIVKAIPFKDFELFVDIFVISINIVDATSFKDSNYLLTILNYLYIFPLKIQKFFAVSIISKVIPRMSSFYLMPLLKLFYERLAIKSIILCITRYILNVIVTLGSPVIPHRVSGSSLQPHGNASNHYGGAFQAPDSSSATSSCNSSTPSSPAVGSANCATPSSPVHTTHFKGSLTYSDSQFQFPGECQ